jgi:hypothetical protein
MKIDLEPIKTTFGPEMEWRDDIGNGMAIGKSSSIRVETAPDNTVRVAFGDLSEPIIALLGHLTGDLNASRDYLQKAVEAADASPTLPYFQRIGEVGSRVVRRVAVETFFHELYVTLPKTAAPTAS